MQARRSQGAAPVAIALPSKPLHRRRSSLLSASSPRTPSGSPRWSPIFLSSAVNRNSTDSWNSSNGPDESEWEWKPEQVLLLTRTMDALPAHLVTPFIGPVPPSNLLDKIARGVAQAKGPVDWPHSVRATRVKLLELAKIRAKEEALQKRKIGGDALGRETKPVANGLDAYNGKVGNGQNLRRPLYRQNSMDFMNAAESHLNNEENITRLSSRLQHTDKPVPTSYSPYTRKSRPQPFADRRASPLPANVTPLINPSTPSSSTLTSLISLAPARSGYSRQSLSSLSTASSMSINSGASLSHPCIQRVKSTEANLPPMPPSKDTKLPKLGNKRAPSFGVLAQGIKCDREATTGFHQRRDSTTSSCPSSDEEEKIRSAHIKKQRTRVHNLPTSTHDSASPGGTPPPTSPPVSSPANQANIVPSTPVLQRSHIQNIGSINTKKTTAVLVDASHSVIDENGVLKHARDLNSVNKGIPMNLQRNPSILGPELPRLPPSAPEQDSLPTSQKQKPTQSILTRLATPIASLSVRLGSPLSPSPLLHSPAQASPNSNQIHRIRTLRRVRRLAPGRRISFGSLVASGINDDVDGNVINTSAEGGDKRICLGSAFQMH
ncbi:hypothetical protein AX17_007386 [Amanita inopinata Kibby_2008]|nr:hypothetical protein AX17_007386 [Amanita inopinata Kibby_2008]